MRAIMAIVPNSRTREFGSAFRCSAEGCVAVSRKGVTHALCRQLVAAGHPDQPLEVCGPNGSLHFTIRSIHEWAKLTTIEDRRGIRQVPYQPEGLARLKGLRKDAR